MIKAAIVAILLASSAVAYSQSLSNSPEKSAQYGFNIGLNYANAFSKNDLPANTSLHNGVGFSLGVLADYKLNKVLSFSPKAELAFFDSHLNRSLTDGTETTYTIMPNALDLKVHLTVKKSGQRISPYLVIGPSVKIPIGNRPKVSTEFGTGYDIAIDFGIGLMKAYSRFNIAPELRYSYGLRNVNENPILKSMCFHNISLVVNFMG